MFILDEDHSPSTLNKVKGELNKFFNRAKCREVLYTTNTDKLFFGMRVYPVMSGDDAINIIQSDEPTLCTSYYIEIDSKLYDPMLHLTEKEVLAILLHEIGHIVYDTGTMDEVKANLDVYFANTDEFPVKPSEKYKEVLAYAMKDSVMKVGSLFSKFGNDEIIADAFVASCGYGPYLESGFRKISRSTFYLGKNVDNKLVVLSWSIRLAKELKIKRLAAIKTLNKAKQLTGSELEKREIRSCIGSLNKLENISEGIIGNIKNSFTKKHHNFKIKGLNVVKNEIYELNLKLRTAEEVNDLLQIIRVANSDIAILNDYYANENLTNLEREEINRALEELYDIRERAAKSKNVRGKFDSIIQITYPTIK